MELIEAGKHDQTVSDQTAVVLLSYPMNSTFVAAPIQIMLITLFRLNMEVLLARFMILLCIQALSSLDDTDPPVLAA